MSLNGNLSQDILNLMNRLGLAYIYKVAVIKTQLVKIVLPVNTFEILLELLKRHFVIIGSRITQLNVAVRLLSDTGLNQHNVFHLLLSDLLIKAAEGEHTYNVLLKCLTDSGGSLISIQIVFFLTE